MQARTLANAMFRLQALARYWPRATKARARARAGFDDVPDRPEQILPLAETRTVEIQTLRHQLHTNRNQTVDTCKI